MHRGRDMADSELHETHPSDFSRLVRYSIINNRQSRDSHVPQKSFLCVMNGTRARLFGAHT